MAFEPSENPITNPTRESYTELRPFRFWCQKVLPLVYDDSLSYYELLCKVVDYLNKTMEDVDHMNTDMDTLYSNFQQFQEGTIRIYNELVAYVNTYFENLDVQEAINNKLDEMVTSGELVTILQPTIADEVATWLNEHLTPTQPTIDNTLTVSGAGADARKVGLLTANQYDASKTYETGEYCLNNGTFYLCVKRIETPMAFSLNNWKPVNISDEIADVAKSVRSTLTGEIVWRNGYYLIENGNYNAYSLFNATEKIPLFDSSGSIIKKVYAKVRLNTAAFVCFYDADKNLLNSYTTEEVGNPIFEISSDIEPNAYYMAISCLAEYTPTIISSYYKTDLNQIINLTTDKRNLFDPYDSRIVLGKFIDGNGNIVDLPATEYGISHPIPVQKNKSYTYQSPTVKFGGASHLLYTDPYGHKESVYNVTIVDGTTTFTASKDGFVIVNFDLDKTGRGVFRFCETEFFNVDYTPYKGKLHKLFLSYNGDSIAESRMEGFDSNGGGYPKLIADITEGTYQNRGHSGATIAVKSGVHNVCTDIVNMDQTAKLVCLEGGVNDYWLSVPLGDFNPTDFTGTVDNTTFCGGMEYMFRQAINRWVGVPIVFVIVHKVTTTLVQNSAGYTFADMREKMIGICTKYSIPYLDMWKEGGLNGFIDSLNNAYLNGGSSVHPDGCHPDVNGYKKYYVPRLIPLFESLIEY